MYQSRNLQFQYPKGPQFQYPDFELPAGENLLILGESGSGKSTLLQLLSGLRQPDAGELSWKGEPISRQTPKQRAKLFGWVFQQMYFVPSLNVSENIRIPLSFQSAPEMNLEQKAEELGIDHLLRQPIGQCSRGEQQRISLLRALIHNPEILLADEPSSSLDNKSCARLIELMLDQCRNAGKTLIIVTHDERLKSHFTRKIEL